jgi:hypothetical protein
MTIVGGPSSASILGPTVTEAALVTRIRRKLLPAEPWQDTLSGNQLIGATTISLTNVTAWGKSDVIELPDGELQHITPFAGTISNPVTVERGHGGTTPAAHTSGDIVFKDPRFPYQLIIDAIDEIVTGESWPYLYAVATQAIVPLSTAELYAVTDGNLRKVIQATQQQTGTITTMRDYPGVEVKYGLATTVAPTGMAFRFPWFDNITNPVTVTYQAQLTSTTIPEGDVAECVMLGAAGKILRSKAVVLSSLDTRPKEAKATIQELIGQAENFENKFHRAKLRVRDALEAQYGEPQPDYGRSLMNFVTW